MQPRAVLINTAGGTLVSQEALYNALKKGQIAEISASMSTIRKFLHFL